MKCDRSASVNEKIEPTVLSRQSEPFQGRRRRDPHAKQTRPERCYHSTSNYRGPTENRANLSIDSERLLFENDAQVLNKLSYFYIHISQGQHI